MIYLISLLQLYVYLKWETHNVKSMPSGARLPGFKSATY